MTALGMDQDIILRFTALMHAVNGAGLQNLDVSVVTPRIIGQTSNAYIGLKISAFTTMFRIEEIDKIQRIIGKIDDFPKEMRQMVDVLMGARDDAQSTKLSKAERSKMI